MSAEHRPPPPYGPEVRVGHLPRIMLSARDLLASGRAAMRGDAIAFLAGQNLRLSSWGQSPSGSLPNGDADLMDAAGIRDRRVWNRVRAAALEGWSEHSDGRLYSAEMAEIVSEAWGKSVSQRDKGAKGGRPRLTRTAGDAAQIGDSYAAANQQLSDSYAASPAQDQAKSMAYDNPEVSHKTERKRKKEEPPSGATRAHEAAADLFPEPEPPPKPKPSRKAPSSAMPDAWAADPSRILEDPAALNSALNRGMTPQEATHEARQFADYHLACGSRFADWRAAWRTWCGNWAQFRSRRGGSGPSGGHGPGGGRRGSSLVDSIMRGQAERNALAEWPTVGRA